MTRFLSPRVLLGAFLCAAVLLTAGCDEEVLGPTLRGSIEGQVRTFGSNAPIAGASVTTSPATGAFVTDGDGAFALRKVNSGAYNISVRRDGFQTNTLPVAVRDGEITPATIFLEKDEDADRTEEVNAEIVNWTNRAEGNDSTFVDVEYRVRNVGTADISAYEVYVRIETAGTSFFQEARGEMLPVSQADVGTFSKFIRGETAQSVAVDDVWFDSTVL
ncbi:carboxypeptidase-like regulatory domain-containing protein [Salinibacter ruber]|uniref:carboxypeptidase-like regulatory domain-containing protein n=1 Tax=Salinibacter ruber TaxID=146919 RepID=UPI0013C32379|nr:carboxypeptidase-like regulatory domain-containing protein [Salinibacter ruber]